MDNEFPFQLVQSCKDDLPVGSTCLFLRKWIFSKPHESAILEDSAVLDLIYQQAMSDIARGRLDSADKDADLRMLKAQKSYKEVGLK